MENVVLEMIEYQPEHQPWFEKFNRQWIEEYFWMEPIDFEVLQRPDEYIISKGGKILVATYNKEIAGTVALKFVDAKTYEFTKMAVDSKFRGLKVGQALGEEAISKAQKPRSHENYFILPYSSCTGSDTLQKAWICGSASRRTV